MRLIYTLLPLLIFVSSCEKRKCECGDDMSYIWKDGIVHENVTVLLPNAVLNIGRPLAFSMSSINSNIEWTLSAATIYQNDHLFLDSENLSSFISGNIIEFPHEVFSHLNEGLISGPVNVELEFFFPESEAALLVEGTIFFYSCSDLNDDFNIEECRWPSQVTNVQTEDPC